MNLSTIRSPVQLRSRYFRLLSRLSWIIMIRTYRTDGFHLVLYGFAKASG